MRIARRIGLAVVTVALAAAAGTGHAGTPPHGATDTPGEGLLEFLGSVDASSDSSRADGNGWLAYLAQVNIGKAAKASQTQQPSAAPAQPKPASAPAAAGKPPGA